MSKDQATAGIEPNTDAEVEREIDAEDRQAATEMRRLGMDDGAIERTRGRPVAEIFKEPPTRASIDAELDELRKLRTTDRRKYWSREVQEREAGLYAQRDKLKAEGASAEGETEVADAGVADSDLPEALRKEWSKGPGGIEDALKAIRERTIIAFQGLEDGGESLRASFDAALDAESQIVIASGLANDNGKWPVASPTEVQEFGELAHGGVLIKEWGKDAGRMLGRAKREAQLIESRLTERSKLQLHNWIARRSPAELSAAVRVLATRAMRRL
jgi:hypothetical protein